jgi:acetyl esterase
MAITTFPSLTFPPLDARIRAYLDSTVIVPVWQVSLAEARANFAKRIAAIPRLNDPVAGTVDRSIEGVPTRVYTPAGQGPFPVLVFIHGGGWYVGNPDTVDDLCRSLCSRAGAVVVAVDYSLSPESKFPKALEECFAVLKWCGGHAGEIGGDPKRLAVAGDSAGGNLAAALALYARDRGGPRLALQVLIYPVTNDNFDTASYHQFATGFGLTREAMMYYWKAYLGKPEDGANPYASPLRVSDLKGLPPALIQTAQYDVLRDDGEAYAVRLEQAGVPVQCTRYLTLNHGFIQAGAVLADARAGLDEIAAALKQTPAL